MQPPHHDGREVFDDLLDRPQLGQRTLAVRAMGQRDFDVLIDGRRRLAIRGRMAFFASGLVFFVFAFVLGLAERCRLAMGFLL